MTLNEAPPSKNGQVPIPGWVAATGTVLAWASGGAILVVELLGKQRLGVMGLAAWLITLPTVALSPVEALRVAVREIKRKGR